MLDFHRRHRPPNYLGRRAQWRLLALFAALGLVVVLIGRTGQPETWAWMWSGQSSDAAQAAEPSQPPEKSPDTRLAALAPKSSEPDGLVVAPPPVEGPQPQRRLMPGVDPELLATVRDDNVFRAAEHEAFFSLLELLRDTDERSLEAHSTGPVGYVQLFRQPAQYRGELVTLRGWMRQALYIEAQPNEYDIKGYWKTVLQPADAPDSLIFVYVLDLPEGFPTGERIRAEVKLTGFFFKRWAYAAQDAPRTAPLVLAKTATWLNSPRAAGDAPAGHRAGPVVAVTALVVVAAVGVVLYVTRLPRSRRRADEGDSVRQSLDSLRSEPTAPPPSEALGELARDNYDPPDNGAYSRT